MVHILCYELDDRGSIPGRGGEGIFLASACRPILGSTKPFIKWVPVALSSKVKRLEREANHLRLGPKLRMRGAIPPLPNSSS
jgi:hypothetical protein